MTHGSLCRNYFEYLPDPMLIYYVVNSTSRTVENGKDPLMVVSAGPVRVADSGSRTRGHVTVRFRISTRFSIFLFPSSHSDEILLVGDI
jgi:hypothetical protein